MLLVVPEHLHTLVADARLAVVMLTAGPDFLPCGSGKSLALLGETVPPPGLLATADTRPDPPLALVRHGNAVLSLDWGVNQRTRLMSAGSAGARASPGSAAIASVWGDAASGTRDRLATEMPAEPRSAR